MAGGSTDQPVRCDAQEKRGDAHQEPRRPQTGALPAGRERGPSASLPKTARRILDASKSLLQEKGYGGLTFDAIAAESGSNKSMIRYYFGSKDGLVAALVDDLTHDATIGLLDMARTAQGSDDLLRAHLAGTRRLMEDPSFKSLFDVLPEAMRRPQLRDQVAALYEWYREVEVVCLGGTSPADDPDLHTLACLLMAAIDGLAMQAVLSEEHVDLDACWTMLASMVDTYLSTRGTELKATVTTAITTTSGT